MPAELLNAFDGQSPNGDWKLTLSNENRTRNIALNAWNLDLKTGVTGSSPEMLDLDLTDARETPNGGQLPQQTIPLPTINIDGSGLGTVVDVKVELDLTHPRFEDLDIFLRSPAGTRVKLFSDLALTDALSSTARIVLSDDAAVAIDQDNPVPTLNSPVRPQGTVGQFVGEDPDGEWQLVIFDDQFGEVGKLNGWKLSIETTEPNQISEGDRNVVVSREGLLLDIDVNVDFAGATDDQQPAGLVIFDVEPGTENYKYAGIRDDGNTRTLVIGEHDENGFHDRAFLTEQIVTTVNHTYDDGNLQQVTIGTTAFPDTDGDGLPDSFEKVIGSKIFDASDPFTLTPDVDTNDVTGPADDGISDLVERALIDFGPAAAYKLDDTSGTTATDSAGDHPARFNGVTLAQTGNPVTGGNAVQFDGVDDFIAVNKPLTHTELNGQNYSIELWFNTAATNTQQDLVAILGGADGSDGHVILLEISNTNKLRFLNRIPAGSSGGQNLLTNSSITPNRWYHLVAVREGKTMRVYLDGQQDAVTVNNATGSLPEVLDLVMGQQSRTLTSRHYNGLLDNVVLYNRALSAADIQLRFEGKDIPITVLTDSDDDGTTDITELRGGRDPSNPTDAKLVSELTIQNQSSIPLGNLFDDANGSSIGDAVQTNGSGSAAAADLGVDFVNIGGDAAGPITSSAGGPTFDFTSIGWTGGSSPNSILNDEVTGGSGIRTAGVPGAPSAVEFQEGIGFPANGVVTYDLDILRMAGALPFDEPFRFISEQAGLNDTSGSLLAGAAGSHFYGFGASGLDDAFGGPALTQIGGSLASGGYQFGDADGLSLTPPANFNPREYVISFDFRLDALGGFQKILDFGNLGQDEGLYAHNNDLRFFNEDTASGVLQSGDTHRLVFSRNDATSQVRALLDGMEVLNFTDSADEAVFSGPSNIIRFFQDDSDDFSTEEGAGFVDNIGINLTNYVAVLVSSDTGVIAGYVNGEQVTVTGGQFVFDPATIPPLSASNRLAAFDVPIPADAKYLTLIGSGSGIDDLVFSGPIQESLRPHPTNPCDPDVVPTDLPCAINEGPRLVRDVVHGDIVDLNVRLDIEHPDVAQLDIKLIAPNGAEVQLVNQQDVSGNRLGGTKFDSDARFPLRDGVSPFAGSFKPAGDLTILNGVGPQGTWKLEINDSIDDPAVGAFGGWSLELITKDTRDPEPAAPATTRTINVTAKTLAPPPHDTATTSLRVDVLNDAPEIELTGPDIAASGIPYTLTLGDPTDPVQDDLDSLRDYLISWGDGETEILTKGTTTATHPYTISGVNKTVYITVTLIDRDGVHTGAGFKKITVNPAKPDNRDRPPKPGPDFQSCDLIVHNEGDVDDGNFDDLSLREAVRFANSAPGLQVICFAGNVNDIDLDMANGTIPITDSVIILGPSDRRVTVKGTDASRIFDVGGDGENFYHLVRLYLSGGDAGAENGGAISLSDADDTLWLTNMSIQDADADNGGSIHVTGGATLDLLNVGLVGNRADTAGSALFVQDSTAILTNVTVSGGQTASSAIENRAATDAESNLQLRNVTLALNDGVGVNTFADADSEATTEFTNVILAGNTGANVTSTANGNGNFTLVDNGGNLLDDGTLNGTTSSSFNLGPLDAITATHPLMARSIAIDAGIVYDGLPLSDQRGFPIPRVVDGNEDGNAIVDSGAFEAPEGTFGGNNTGPKGLVVTTADDIVDGDLVELSLREAILFGNSCTTASAINITFHPDLVGETITLVDGQLLITHPNMTITGLGANALSVNGAGRTRVFQIAESASASISEIMVSGGFAVDGGGIQNLGSLNLAGVVVSGNQATELGGGIDNAGSLTITTSSILNNIATDGGGVFTEGMGVAIARSTIAGNLAVDSAGGIANAEELTLTNVTISGNQANEEGGGIGNQGQLTIIHSTIVNNTADLDGINPDNDHTGGGIDTQGGDGSLEIFNSIVASNFGPGSDPNVTGTPPLASSMNNLLAGDPMLGPLTDNGGPTLTHAPLPGNTIVVDQGIELASTPLVDQRGFGRVVDQPDLGALEAIAVSISDVQADEFAGVLRFTATLNGSIPDGETASVRVSTSEVPGQATGEVDYLAFGQRLITFDSTSNSKTVSVDLINDLQPENNETFMAQLSSPFAVTVNQPEAVGTIIDDDTPGFTVDPTSVVVFEQGLGGQITVVLTSQPDSQVNLVLTPSDPDAAIVDISGMTFTRSTWNIPQTANVIGVDNGVVDGSGRTSTITVSVDDLNSDDAFDGLDSQTVDVTTLDGGGAGFTVTPRTLSVLEGATATFDVVLTTAPATGQSVTFNVSSNNPSAATVSPTTLTFDGNNFSQPQTVTVNGVNNFITDNGRTSIIVVSVDDANSDDAFDNLADQSVLVTTVDVGVGTGGDLEITSFVITDPHALLGQVPVELTILNNGNSVSSETTVALLLDDDIKLTPGSNEPAPDPGPITVPPIAPGGSVTITQTIQLDRAQLFQASITSDEIRPGDASYTSRESFTLAAQLGDATPISQNFVYFPYDMNGPSGSADGLVESLDAIFIVNFFGQQPAITDPAARADLNGDGIVESLDFVAIVNRFGNCINTTVVTDVQNFCTPGEPEFVDVHDVDGNGLVSGADALMIINRLGEEAEQERTEAEPGVYDVNRDGFVSSLDALLVVNALQIADVAKVENTGGVQASANWVLPPLEQQVSPVDQIRAASIDQVLASGDESDWDLAFLQDDDLDALF